MTKNSLTMWTVTYNPSDYPGKWVLRGRDIPGEVHAEAFACESLEEARSHVPYGLIWQPRAVDDDPVIVEVWF